MYNEEIFKKKLQRITDKLEEYMKILDQEDKDDDTTESDEDATQTPLSKKIESLQKRKNLYEEYLNELLETGETQKLITDPEARMMTRARAFIH